MPYVRSGADLAITRNLGHRRCTAVVQYKWQKDCSIPIVFSYQLDSCCPYNANLLFFESVHRRGVPDCLSKLVESAGHPQKYL